MASHEGHAAGGAAGGASGTKRKANAMSSDDTKWPAPGDEAYGTMHEEIDKHWVECELKIRQFGMFFAWWRMVRDYFIEIHNECGEGPCRDEDETGKPCAEWTKYWSDRRLTLIGEARERIEDPTENAIKFDALSHYKGWSNYPNW